MQNQNFNISFVVEQTPNEVFNSIIDVRSWWSEKLEGNSEKIDEEFCYRHGDFHYSKHKLIEVEQDKKVVWLTIESQLTLFKVQDEWNETKMIFEISEQDNKTKLNITHWGLLPDLDCFEACSRAWTYYLKDSLFHLITTGIGKPDKAD